MCRILAVSTALLLGSCGGTQPPPNPADLLALESAARAACELQRLEASRLDKPLPARVVEACARFEAAKAPPPCAVVPATSGLPEGGAGGAP